MCTYLLSVFVYNVMVQEACSHKGDPLHHADIWRRSTTTDSKGKKKKKRERLVSRRQKREKIDTEYSVHFGRNPTFWKPWWNKVESSLSGD